jgi:ubiquinone/menaquinone biosynthesis C-methylase UbiE
VIDDHNKTAYTAPRIVNYYAQLNTLQPAEKAVLDLLKRQPSTIKMLDIGVGGGRTSQHFSKITSEYIGIDYSAEMISACNKRFSASSQKMKFEVCDARDMSQFADNSFDFILFSFNGLDYTSHLDRLKIFQEISRVGKPGGYFFFSSHNLQGLDRQFDIRKQLSFNPLKTYVNLVMFALLRFFNRPITLTQLKAADYAIIRDESHNFRLNTYYIRPKEQIHQLSSCFHNLRVYSWKKEIEIADDQELRTNDDMWLYYFCNINRVINPIKRS